MRKPRIYGSVRVCLLLLGCVLLAACAVQREAGWKGKDAQPFDAAYAQCKAEAEDSADSRQERMQACMAERGWTRDPADQR